MRRKVCVSFSGGRTSAFMAYWAKHNIDADLCFIFANTGCEHEKTLEFVDRCDKEWDLGVVWVEASVHHGQRKASTHTEVSFDTASRQGEPFEAVISKYGVPNQKWPHCTRELKLNPIKSYLVEKGWWGEHEMAVGIRIDEIDRMQADAKKKRIFYPLISHVPMTKDQVAEWWSRQNFDLGLPPILGNCVWCWKKSDRKLMTLAQDDPSIFDFPDRMERQYGHKSLEKTGKMATFFRLNRSAQDIIASSKEPFERWQENSPIQNVLFSELDLAGGCSESCEVEW